jgi:hypothetical protein
MSYANTRFVTQPLQNPPPLCSSTAWTEFGALAEDGIPFWVWFLKIGFIFMMKFKLCLGTILLLYE